MYKNTIFFSAIICQLWSSRNTGLVFKIYDIGNFIQVNAQNMNKWIRTTA